MHSYHYQISRMTVCGQLKQEVGGKMKVSVLYRTTLPVTQRSQTSESSWMSGKAFMTARVESVAFSIENQLVCKSKGLDEEIPTMTLEQILAPRLYSGTINSVTSQKLWSDLQTQKMIYTEKSDSPQSWVHGKAHSLTLNTSVSSGKRIAQKKDC